MISKSKYCWNDFKRQFASWHLKKKPVCGCFFSCDLPHVTCTWESIPRDKPRQRKPSQSFTGTAQALLESITSPVLFFKKFAKFSIVYLHFCNEFVIKFVEKFALKSYLFLI